MENWIESKIEDTSIQMIDGDRGKNYPKNSDFFSQGYCLFLNAGNVTKTGFSFSENSFITENKDRMLRKGRLERNDVVITTRGTVGNVALYDSSVPYEHLRINSGMLILKGGRDILPEYLYYFLKGKSFQAQLSLYVSGTAQPQLPKSTLGKMMISFPVELNVQKKICGILKSLDDKITVNKKICENLEAQAQALFKHWFVDFAPFKDGKFVESELGMIPEGWRVMPIDKVFSIKYGKNLPTSKIEERGKYPVYGANGIMGYYSDYNYDNYVTLITSRGSGSGDISRTFQEKTFITNNSFAVSPKDIYSYLSYAYTYYCIKNINFKPYCSGSAQPQLTNASINAISILLPDEKTIIKYNSLVSLIYNEINRSQSESAKLSTLRDTLLPKLMSGQIKL